MFFKRRAPRVALLEIRSLGKSARLGQDFVPIHGLDFAAVVGGQPALHFLILCSFHLDQGSFVVEVRRCASRSATLARSRVVRGFVAGLVSGASRAGAATARGVCLSVRALLAAQPNRRSR